MMLGPSTGILGMHSCLHTHTQQDGQPRARSHNMQLKTEIYGVTLVKKKHKRNKETKTCLCLHTKFSESLLHLCIYQTPVFLSYFAHYQ